MRKAVNIVLSQALLLVVVVAMMGVPLQKMECLITGKTTVALYDLSTCCAETAPSSPTIYDDCCAFSSELFKVEEPAVEHSFELQTLPSISNLSVAVLALLDHPVVPVRTHAFADLPPPISRAERCVSHQTFLI